MRAIKSTLVAIFCCSAVLNSAKDFYVAQTPLGSNSGLACEDAHAVSWFNSAGNWGTGASKISPGDTVHLCGVITNKVVVAGSGASNAPVTILFEPGAKLSQPAGGLMSCFTKAFIIIDGGVNGIIENTDNGTFLSNKVAVSGITASGSHDLEVKNLTFQNLYVHVGTNDPGSTGLDANGAVYMNGFGSNVSIHNCAFRDICWVLNLVAGSGSGLNIYSNRFLNFDHGIAGLGNAYSNVMIFRNEFGSTANWDTSVNKWHHDGIHIFYGAGATLSKVAIFENMFRGDWGKNNTAQMYFEGDFTRANPASLSDFTIYNNLFWQETTNNLNNGLVAGGGPNWRWLNNTFLGAGIKGSIAMNSKDGTGTIIANNIFSGFGTFIKAGTSASFNNNIYSMSSGGGNPPWIQDATGYQDHPSWVSASGELGSQYSKDPVVNSDGTLKPGSIAISKGSDFSTLFGTDISGGIRKLPWDVGAFRLPSPSAPTNLRPLEVPSP